MSDDLPLSSHPGTLSPRNVDTVTYKVLQELPIAGIAPVGGRFTSWPQGMVFACVSGVGLGPVTNGDILSWMESGMIERVTPLTAAQERALYAETREQATVVAAEAEIAPASGKSRPWTLSGAEAAKE